MQNVVSLIWLFCKRDLLCIHTDTEMASRHMYKCTSHLAHTSQRNSLQQITTHCNIPKHTATRSNTLQRSKIHCSTLFTTKKAFFRVTARGATLQHTAILNQHTATHCHALQCTAMHSNALQCTAILCNTLQYNATHCDRLQHNAMYCNTLQHTAPKDTLSSLRSRENKRETECKRESARKREQARG